MATEPALPQNSNEGWSQLWAVLRLHHFPTRQYRLGISARPLMVTDPCCYRATDPDLAPVGSTGQDPAPESHVESLQNHFRLISLPSIFSSASSYCAHILLVPFLFHFSIIYLLIFLWSLSVWGHLRNARPCSCIMVPSSGHFRYGLPT